MQSLSVFGRTALRRGFVGLYSAPVQRFTSIYPVVHVKYFSTSIDDNAVKLKDALSYFRGNEEAGQEVDKRHFEVMKEAADRGDPRAQLCVAYGYTVGKGVSESSENMLKYVMMGVEQNHVDSLLYAADIYFYGLGVPPDPALCFKYYKAAADLGDTGAQSNVGLRLMSGSGVEKNVKEGMKYLVMSADKGDVNGQYYAGLFFSNGFEGEVEVDDELSYHYLKAAAEKGHSEAQFALGVQYYQGTSVVAQSPQKAFKYTKLSADQKNSKALYNLGQFYTEGTGTAVDLQEAFKCFQAAATAASSIDEDNGDVTPLMKVAQCWMEGTGTPRDPEQAYLHYLKAAEQNDARAQFRVAECLERGVGVTQNQEEAVKYFTLSAAQGNKEAQYTVGVYHLEGKGGCTADAKNARVWLKMAANQGHVEALKALDSVEKP